MGWMNVTLIWIAVGCLTMTSGTASADAPVKTPSTLEFAERLEKQYPELINLSPSQGVMLLKSRIGGQFILSLRYPPYGETRKIAESTQTQLALTWHPQDLGIAWLEPVKQGCGFQPRYLELKSHKLTEFKSVLADNASLPLRFSPDGRFLAMVAGSKINVVDISKPDGPPAEWFDGVQGGSDFVWTSSSEMIVSPNDGKGMIFRVSAREKRGFAVFEPGSEIRNLSWSQEAGSLLASLRHPKDEYDSIINVKKLPSEVSSKMLYEAVIKKTSGNSVRPQWIQGGRDFLFISQEEDTQRLWLKLEGNTSPQELMSTQGEIEILDTQGHRVTILEKSSTSRPLPWMLNLRNSNGDVQANITAQPVYFPHNDMKAEAPKTISLTAKDGVRLYIQHWQSKSSQVHKPSAVLWIHGGPHLRESVKWNAEIQEMQANGVDVVQVNYRGSSGYGRAFENLGDHRSRLEDIDAALEYLNTKRNIPTSRVVLMGSSYGGFLAVNYVHARNLDLKGAVLSSPGTMQDSAGESTDHTKSPVKHPIYVFQGQQDCVIPPARGIHTLEELLGRGFLKYPGVGLKVFPDEGHHFHKTSSRAEVWSKVLEVLGRD